jgi:hypothetical protein
MKRYTEKLILMEKEFDIDLSIYEFNNMIHEDMDVKYNVSYILKLIVLIITFCFFSLL